MFYLVKIKTEKWEEHSTKINFIKYSARELQIYYYKPHINFYLIRNKNFCNMK